MLLLIVVKHDFKAVKKVCFILSILGSFNHKLNMKRLVMFILIIMLFICTKSTERNNGTETDHVKFEAV